MSKKSSNAAVAAPQTETEMEKQEQEVDKKSNYEFVHPDSFYNGLTEFEKMIWRLMKANKGVISLISPPGYGKTAFASAFAEKTGKCFIPLHLTSYEEVDVAGLPFREKYDDGIHDVMKYALPEWAVMANECEEENGALVLLDEANRCKVAVMNATLRVLNEKSIGYDFEFNDNIHFILTGNIGSFSSSESDGAEVNSFDSAMYGRLYTINLLDYAKMWNEHWFTVVGNFLSKPLYNYLKANPSMIHQYDESSNETAFPSHRSNTNLHHHLVANLGEDADNINAVLTLQDDFAAIIGASAARKFITYLEDMNKINGLSILNEYKKVFKIIKNFPQSRHQDLVQDMKNFRFQDVTKIQSDNLSAYLTYLTKDLGYDDVVAGMIDFLVSYDMPDFENGEQNREQEHLVKLEKFGFVNKHISAIAKKLEPELPFDIED